MSMLPSLRVILNKELDVDGARQVAAEINGLEGVFNVAGAGIENGSYVLRVGNYDGKETTRQAILKVEGVSRLGPQF